MSDIPLVGLRAFREQIARFTEPVRVVHTRGGLHVLGTWIPAGSAPPSPKVPDPTTPMPGGSRKR